MLVLSRQQNEDIVILPENGGAILVRVVGIRSDKVRIGLEGPKSTQFIRRELYEPLADAGSVPPLPGMTKEEKTNEPL